MLVVITVVNACKKDKVETTPFFPAELATVKTALAASFDSLNNSLSVATTQFAQTGIDTTAIRSKLFELYNNFSFTKEFSFITLQGIMQLIEPAVYYSYQGSDISAQSSVVSAFQTKLPVLSNAFILLEGYQATIDIHPIVADDQLLGAISAVIAPEILLGSIILPIVQDVEFEIWVMEKSGMVLFDQDAGEIGLNVLTDPLYADFTELIAACQLMAEVQTGETTYSFFQTGTASVVTKKTYWNTFSMHGNEWKIVWVIPV